jgi:hypothetical protein
MSQPISHLTKNSAFHVYKNDANQILVPPTNADVHFTVKNFDILNEFDTATYTFTAKKRGFYLFGTNLHIKIPVVSGLNYGFDRFLTNIAPSANNLHYFGAVTGDIYPQSTFCKRLNAGDTVKINYLITGANPQQIFTGTDTFFWGRRLQ